MPAWLWPLFVLAVTGATAPGLVGHRGLSWSVRGSLCMSLPALSVVASASSALAHAALGCAGVIALALGLLFPALAGRVCSRAPCAALGLVPGLTLAALPSVDFAMTGESQLALRFVSGQAVLLLALAGGVRVAVPRMGHGDMARLACAALVLRLATMTGLYFAPWLSQTARAAALIEIGVVLPSALGVALFLIGFEHRLD